MSSTVEDRWFRSLETKSRGDVVAVARAQPAVPATARVAGIVATTGLAVIVAIFVGVYC
jgi:hypothetical protein